MDKGFGTHLLGTDILRCRNMLSTLRNSIPRSQTLDEPADLNLALRVTLSTQPSCQLVAAGVTLYRTLVVFTAFTVRCDLNRYITAHALTLALIFWARISSWCVSFTYKEGTMHFRSVFVAGQICCRSRMKCLGGDSTEARAAKGDDVLSDATLRACCRFSSDNFAA